MGGGYLRTDPFDLQRDILQEGRLSRRQKMRTLAFATSVAMLLGKHVGVAG